MTALFFLYCSMSRYHSHLSSARRIIDEYNAGQPFAAYLKKFFAEKKKYGSKDRKQIAHLCYCFFRLGKAAPLSPKGGISEESLWLEEKILMGLFLCSAEPDEMLSALKPEWNEKIHLQLEEKLSLIDPPAARLPDGQRRAGYSLLITELFPWQNELSDGIDHEKFCASFFTQSGLFIRIRPGYEKNIPDKLRAEGLTPKTWSETCIQLPNSTNIEKLVEIDKEAVIQDYSSQQTGDFLKNLKPTTSGFKPKIWDCCAGSGGKSIMLYDIFPEIELTVSDIRESILANLKKRFAKAGIKKYKSFAADLSIHSPLTTHHSPFDLIICDAPCTGSGTWSRTPEQLYFFNQQTIEKYSDRQKKIVTNVIPYLKPGGHLLYITCSVFKKENEEVVQYIQNNLPIQLTSMKYLKGYNKKADTLFAALFRKE